MGRQFWIYVGGRCISLLGDGFGTIAMGWLVYELTGSKLAMGSIYLAGMIPEIILRLFGAPLLDRLNRTRLMAGLDFARFVAYLAPLLLLLSGRLELWHLYGLRIVAGAAASLYAPAAGAVIPSLVEDRHLLRANALSSGLFSGMLVTGPMVAGLVVSLVGSQWALLLDGITFALSGLNLLLLPAAVGTVKGKAPQRQNYFRELAVGFRFFGQVPALLVLTTMLGITYMSAWAIFSMHAPYVAEQLGGDATLVGAMQAGWPLGYLLGSSLLGYIGEVRHRRTIMLSGLIGVGVALAGLSFGGPTVIYLALACKVLEGASFAFFSTTETTIFQKLVPDQIRGRAMSVRMLLSWGGNPLGAFLGGYLGERIGLANTFLIMGLIPIVVGAAGFLLPLLRSVDGELRPVEEATA